MATPNDHMAAMARYRGLHERTSNMSAYAETETAFRSIVAALRDDIELTDDTDSPVMFGLSASMTLRRTEVVPSLLDDLRESFAKDDER